MLLRDKTVVVSGAASGIGRAVANAAIAAGGEIVFADIDSAAVERAAQESGSMFHTVDVSDAASVKALFQAVVERHGGVDVIINVAGVQTAGKIMEIAEEDWDRQFAVNVRGTFLMTKYGGPHMLGRGGASIVNIASAGGLRGFEGLSAYGSSKAAVIAFTKTAAKELAPYGIRVNALSPGWVDTPFNDPFIAEVGGRAEVDALVAGSVPLQRQSSPTEMAHNAIYLASSMSSYVTGHNLVADGGFTV